MQPLLTLTKHDVPFKLTAYCQEACDLLKQELMSAPILAHPQDRGRVRNMEMLMPCHAINVRTLPIASVQF